MYLTGIWGGKGQGKSFQTELIFQAMGVEPVIMSAGELESERAGKILLNAYKLISMKFSFLQGQYYSVCVYYAKIMYFSPLLLMWN